MGDVLQHSKSSAKKFGGKPSDYIKVHKFLDKSKLYIGDWRHRALLHTTFGVDLCEQFFGDTFKRESDGVEVCTRTVASEHIVEDLGAILTPAEFLKEMPIKRWMNGLRPEQIKRLQEMRIEDQEKHKDIEFEI